MKQYNVTGMSCAACSTRVEKVNGGRIVYTDGDGREVKDYLDHIGYLPQNFDVFPELTACEVLQFFANLKGYKITEAEIDHILDVLPRAVAALRRLSPA